MSAAADLFRGSLRVNGEQLRCAQPRTVFEGVGGVIRALFQQEMQQKQVQRVKGVEAEADAFCRARSLRELSRLAVIEKDRHEGEQGAALRQLP